MTKTSTATRLMAESVDLNSSIERLCEGAAVQLFEQLDAMEAMTDLLHRASDIASGEGQENFRRSIEDVGSHLDTVAQTYGELGEISGQLKKNVTDISGRLDSMKREIRLASMVATNAQVLSRSLSERNEALEHFAQDVKDLLQGAAETTARLAAEMGEADADLRPVTAAIKELTKAVSGLEQQRRALPEQLRMLAGLRGLHRTVGHATEAHARIVDALRHAVTDLQGGDAARQRLEHVVTMLKRLDPAPGGEVRPVIEALAAAQLADTARTFGAELTAALAQLRIIRDSRRAAGAAVRDLASMGVTRTFDSVGRLLGQLNAGLSQLASITAEIAPEIARLSQGYARGAASVEAIAGLEAEMHGLGINAILVARKIGTHGQAMTEVARQLRECTGRIGKESQFIIELARAQEAGATRFAAGSGTDGHEERTRLQQLESETKALARTFAEAESLLGDTESGPLPQITRGLSELARRNTGVAMVLPDSDAQRWPASLSPSQRMAVDAARTLYTMQAERRIHDILFPPQPDSRSAPAPLKLVANDHPRSAPSVPAFGEGDSDDDVFF
ncbi:hypothetical protein LCM17_14605 [Cereibacter sphaeroides]|nr:hypothetical protein [Cereibacter sphaeroides]